MKRASVADVARRAGVSTATVSRVINTPERVAEPTRSRVITAIEALHYVQSATALSFKAQRSRNILVVAEHVGNIYYSELFLGIQRRAEANGYAVIITSATAGDGKQQVVDQLRAGRVDGVVILSGCVLDAPALDLLGKLNGGTAPVVGFAERAGDLAYPHVFIDNFAAGRMATQHLIAAGHRRIGHITGPVGAAVTEERQRGYLAALAEAGLDANPDHVFVGNFRVTEGRRAARIFASLADRPTAMFAGNDESAMGFISELSLLGVSVPRDVSVIGFDNIAFADAYVPALTTISQPKEEIGARAMGLLLEAIDNAAGPAERIVELKTRLIQRASVAPPQAG